ncbi:GR28B protein, partial [Pseudoatta argentina]
TIVITMVTTIKQAIHPLILTSSLLGLGIYSSKKLYLSVFYNLTLWITYGYLFYYIVTVLKLEIWFQSTYAIIDMQFGILTSITSVIINMYLNKRFQIIIKRLAAVDNTLKALGIPKLYHKLYIRAKGILIGWLICTCIGNMCDMAWWFYIKEDRWCLLIPHITNYFYHVNMFVDLLFITILWLVYYLECFDKISEYVKCLLVKDGHELKCTQKKAVMIPRQYITYTDNYKHAIWILMRMWMLIKRLAAVDNTLKELGTPKLYRKLHIRIKRILIGWLVCSQTNNIIDSIWWFCTIGNHWCLIIPYVTNHYQHVNVLMDLLFIIFLWYIGTRFDKLNEYMKYLLLKEEHDVRRTWTNAVQPTHQYNMCINNYSPYLLWITMHLHLELCQVARELNAIFETQITMEMATYLACLARLFNYILLYIIEDEIMMSLYNLLDISFWMFLQIARLFCLNYICKRVSTKSNKMNAVIHDLTDSFRHAVLHDEIYQFTLQIIHHPLKFTGLGLFYFGNGFLRKVRFNFIKSYASVSFSLH